MAPFRNLRAPDLLVDPAHAYHSSGATTIRLASSRLLSLIATRLAFLICAIAELLRSLRAQRMPVRQVRLCAMRGLHRAIELRGARPTISHKTSQASTASSRQSKATLIAVAGQHCRPWPSSRSYDRWTRCLFLPPGEAAVNPSSISVRRAAATQRR